MKSFLILAISCLISSSAFADAGLVNTCVKFKEYKLNVIVTKEWVVFGDYSGRLTTPAEVKNGKIILRDLTLNDGLDGWLDHVDMEVTSTTVRFDSYDYPVVKCD